MKLRNALSALSIAALIVVPGCGGGGSSVPSPFAGAWSGTYDAGGIPDNGTATATITTSGQLTGTVHSTAGNGDGTVSGKISNAGTVSAHVTYPGYSPYPLVGTLAINGSAHLVGNLTETVGSTQYGVSFDLAPQ